MASDRRYLLVAIVLSALTIAACSGKSQKSSTEPIASPTSAASASVTASPGGVGAPAPTGTQDPAVSLTPHPTSGAVPYPTEALPDLQMLFRRTAELRGLQPTSDVPAFLIGRSHAADYLTSTIEPDDRATIALHQEVYRLLGLIPADADLLALQLSLLRGEVLGFYDPDVKSLFILDDLGFTSPVTRITLVHEYTHALQDQHYGLDSHDVTLRDDWDGEAAWIDLIEGDARSMESTFLSPTLKLPLGRFCNGGSFSINTRSEVPPVIQRELNTPYTDGLCFVRTAGPQLPKGDDSIFENLPVSTEQVLHPEKYLAGERPVNVDLPDLRPALGAGWAQIGAGNLGEFTVQNLLLLGSSDQDAVEQAAAGWGGDHWVLYGNGDKRLIQVRIAWDTGDDATEFWQTFVGTLNKRSGGKLKADPHSTSVTWQQGNKTLRAAIKGDNVTFVMATDSGALKAAAGVLGLP